MGSHGIALGISLNYSKFKGTTNLISGKVWKNGQAQINDCYRHQAGDHTVIGGNQEM